MRVYRVERKQGGVVLPPTGQETNFRTVSVWSRSDEAALRRFSRRSLGGRFPVDGGSFAAEVVLIHRPDNTYNPNAISVAMPASFGGTIDERHLGYLYDSYLRRVGMATLPDLADAFGEITCTGILREGPELEVDLPDGPVLRSAIDIVLNARAARTSPSVSASAGRLDGQPLRRHTQPSEATSAALEHIHTFDAPRAPVSGLNIVTSLGHWRRPRSLHLSEAASGRQLGTVALGYLFLEDERDRADVLPHLAESNVPVAQPRTAATVPDNSVWPPSAIPNIWTYWFTERLDLRVRDPENPYSRESIAHYNPTTKKLWVQDSRLVSPACIYAARLGIEILAIGLPRIPWMLDTEVPYDDLKDPALRPQGRDEPDDGIELLRRIHPLVPRDIFAVGSVRWISTPSPVRNPESTTEFVQNERHIPSRNTLFPECQLGTTIADCRLCGQPGLSLHTPICSEPLTYCHRCLVNAARGAFNDRAEAAQALRQLAVHEFDNAPMLESDLDTLHVNPAEPVRGDDVDRLLLMRFAIARRRHPWTHLLEESGLAERGLRSSRGTLIRARDSHLCQSLMEKAVCDFLHQHDIGHQREPLYPVDIDLNPRGRRRADWLLEDGTFVELWGMPDEPAYAVKMTQKRRLAARYRIPLLELIDADISRLPQVFARWLPRDASGARPWSPVIPPAAPADRNQDDPAAGSGKSNAASRAERVRRCLQAVELQSGGMTRRDIGSIFGVGIESVQSLLRDGKFYSDPTTDPARRSRAQDAAAAKLQRQTRSQFAAERRWGNQKAIEAWRDAEAIKHLATADVEH